MNTDELNDETQCVYLGRGEDHLSGFVNPPICRGSTFLYSTLKEYKQSKQDRFDPKSVSYGRYGTATSNELEQAIATLEGGYASMAVSSGLAAVTTALLAFLSAGDHLLMVDSVFGATRRYCDNVLVRCGIDVTYYSPMLGTEIKSLIRHNTKIIFLESPGSLTFEVQDVPSIVNIAKQHSIVTVMDNTWASPLLFKAIKHGVNVSIHAATKHIGGHSDIVLGLIVTDKEHWNTVRKHYINIGQSPASDEVSLALRGLRTLPIRIQKQGEAALKLAKWISQQSCVKRVLHPALNDCPGHGFWQRDFSGSANLFAVELIYNREVDISVFVDELTFFGIGASWGGYESLILPCDPKPVRSVDDWSDRGHLLRISVGLESIDDLIADLEKGFQHLKVLAEHIYN